MDNPFQAGIDWKLLAVGVACMLALAVLLQYRAPGESPVAEKLPEGTVPLSGPAGWFGQYARVLPMLLPLAGAGVWLLRERPGAR